MLATAVLLAAAGLRVKVFERIPANSTAPDLMKDCVFNSEIWLPKQPGEIFPFFGNAHNLEIITPHWLKFQILTKDPIVMRVGTLIDYQIRLRGIPLGWRTRIEVWNPPHRFVDVQVRGPYRHWHHEHIFEPADDGTYCLDRVRYAVFGGRLIDRLFVKGNLEKIFEFRRRKLLEFFNSNARASSGKESRFRQN